MNIIVTGYGRHGKDTFCELLGRPFTSSSFLASGFIYEALKGILDYRSAKACFEDRHNHRALWFELIKAFNAKDPARLANKVFKHHEVYCGMRSIEELEACRQDALVIWVDASERVTTAEESDSMTIKACDCDIIIQNNGTLEALEGKASMLNNYLKVEVMNRPPPPPTPRPPLEVCDDSAEYRF